MAKRRNFFLQFLGKVEYQIEEKWHKAEVNKKEIKGEELLVWCNAPASDLPGTISKVRIFDMDGELAAEQELSLSRGAGEGTLIKWVFPLREVE